MVPLPEDVLVFLDSINKEYEEVFMTVYQSPCASCNQGKPRLVHRSAEMYRLGNSLKEILSRYGII
jgi:hypothetical protein